MGTHLARNNSSYVVQDGQIEGDSIRCPYHGWRFGPDGKCNDIPYSKAPIPKAACVRAWPIVESLGAIFVWYDPEGGEPEWEAPSLPQWNDPQWVRWKFDHLGVIKCHGQEVIDNIADCSHLGPVHGETVKFFRCEFKGHLATQIQGGGHRTLVTPDGVSPISPPNHLPRSRFLPPTMGMGSRSSSSPHDRRRRRDQGLARAPGEIAEQGRDAGDVAAARAYQRPRALRSHRTSRWANKRPRCKSCRCRAMACPQAAHLVSAVLQPARAQQGVPQAGRRRPTPRGGDAGALRGGGNGRLSDRPPGSLTAGRSRRCPVQHRPATPEA